MDTPVLVVGAGPTGLLLAAELWRRGVECTLIDAREEPNRWDRATIVHPRSVEQFATLGFADRFLDLGVHQWGIRLYSGGEQLAAMDLATSGSRFGFNLNVSEEVTERILTEYLGEQGGEVLRGRTLVGLEQHRDGVVATMERDGREEEIGAGWVVGCGGLRSPVRELSGIAFEGHDIDVPWAVFDLTLAGWASDLDVNFAFLDQPPVILTPLPGARWRAYLRPTAPDSDLVAEAAAVIARYDPGAEIVDVANPRRFQCHSKVAATYRKGRALLAGDAAHVCTPAQGHGMNTGLQDAINLAWKLALVAKGEADEALLDSYEIERRPVAEAIVASGDGFESMQALSGAEERAERDRTLRESFADPDTNHHEVVAEVELDIDYAGSPIVVASEDSVLAAGARLPAELHELIAPGHTLLVLTRGARTGPAGDEFFDASVVHAGGPDLADRLGVEEMTILAVRPDGHIGLRHDGAAGGAEAARAYVELVRAGGR